MIITIIVLLWVMIGNFIYIYYQLNDCGYMDRASYTALTIVFVSLWGPFVFIFLDDK